jgi:ribosome-associated toxin RatA of RatAB toxin-antitoxin module
MREVRRSALVPYTPAQMYRLVNDVAGYPKFVPWCPVARVLEVGDASVTAMLEIVRAGVRVKLTTRNTLVPDERIDMALLDGPLARFSGRWDFVPIRAAGDTGGAAGAVRGCRVELTVAFEFKNAAVGLVIGPLFESSWDSLVDAFVKRAHEVYRD